MSINAINNIQNSTFKKITPKDKGAVQPAKTDENNNKKNLALALAGLATVAVAGIGLYCRMHGKNSSKAAPDVSGGIETIKGLTRKADLPVDKTEQSFPFPTEIKGLTRKNSLPFDKTEQSFSIPEEITKDGRKIKQKFFLKEPLQKYEAVYNGKNVIVEEKRIEADNIHVHCGGRFAFIRDKETNELIETKRISAKTGKERAPKKPSKEPALQRKTIKELVPAKNGEQTAAKYITKKGDRVDAIQNTSVLTDGTKRIEVTCPDTPYYIKTITISPDGKREVTEKGYRF